MKYKETIKKLCKEQTNLEHRDVEYLLAKADELLQDSSYMEEDVFIDVKDVYAENNAIVIFHKKPQTRDSLYAKTVVGADAYLENEPGVIRTLQTGMPSIGLSALSQEGIPIYQTVFPIFREHKIIGTLIIESDRESAPSRFLLCKDSAEVYNVVTEHETEYFAPLDYTDDMVLVFNSKGYLVYYNPVAEATYCEKLGYKDSIRGMHYDNLSLDDMRFEEAWKLYFEEDGVEVQKNVQYGEYHFTLKRSKVSEQQCLLMICKDVTELWKAESQLLTHVTTVREMNHRVKNNLQTVVSLLRLQSQKSRSTDIKKSLDDSVNRVLSIATMHDLLSSGYDDHISVDLLLRKVVDNVQRCFLGHVDIKIIYGIDKEIFLDSSRATSLALVVNELLQNSFDHAFNKKITKNPQIRLRLSQKNGIIKLSLSDNGNGYIFSEELVHRHLGLLLVTRFVKSKLSGRLEIHSGDSGTSTTISFKK